MADITRFPILRHLRSTATVYVQHVRNGRVVHDGPGQAFWFRPLTALLSEVPIDDRELPLLFHARTADFQDVTVQATVTFRIIAPAVIVQRIDFAIDPDTGRWRGNPLDQVTGLLTESAQQEALDLIAQLSLTTAVTEGVSTVRQRMADGLADHERLAETGISVLDVRVVAVRPEPEVEKALRTPTRELVRQEADRATHERRALAVESERAIGENELQSQIELARREEELVNQRGANARRQAEESAAADRIEAEAQAEREQRLTEAKAEGTRVMGDATASALAAEVAVYRDLDQAVLLGLAVKDLAGNLPQIGNLGLSPDLIGPALARLAGDRP